MNDRRISGIPVYNSGMKGKKRSQALLLYRRVNVVRSKVAVMLVLSSLLLVVGLSEAAQTEPDTVEQTVSVYLPFVRRVPETAPLNCNVPGSSYGTLSINGSPTEDPPVPENPDFNLRVRGWRASGGALTLVSYDSSEDAKAPQLDTLFGDRRLPHFTGGWNVYDWDWERERPTERDWGWDITLLGLETTPAEVIYTPDSGYDIGSGHDALVLYASPTQLTLKYTREDHVVYGYTIHIEEICVEPDLLARYEQADAAGRHSLPAVRGGQPLGRAGSEQIVVAVRDTGWFMDPRSHYDWWKAQ